MESWKDLYSSAQIEELTKASYSKPQVIFKHSTSCGISAHAQYRLASATHELSEKADLHYLDLLRHRPVSNQIAAELGVPHQSPQVIVLRAGKVIHSSSHFSIDPQAIVRDTVS
jgi:bacillithiol system protein YtxJ